MKNVVIISEYRSPCGVLILGSIGSELCLCDWQTEGHRVLIDRRLRRVLNADFEKGISPVIEEAARQLDEYFAGKRRAFAIPLHFVGTDFQKAVWHELLRIRYGERISYAELARRIGHPRAVRAVANANGANSLSIFVPCHRVVGSNEWIGGYGGGVDAKRCLLGMEDEKAFMSTMTRLT